MAYKRRFKRTRRFRRKGYRRSTRRSFRRRRGIRRRSLNVYHFKRPGQPYTVLTTLAQEFNGSAEFSLDDIVSASEFKNLFQQYRLNCVVVKFVPNWGVMTNTGATAAQSVIVPNFHSVIDTDDSGTQPISSLIEYSNYKFFLFNRALTFKIFPRVSVPAYKTGVVFGYAPAQKPMWIDMNSPDVHHYGFKFGVDSPPNNPVTRFTVRPTYYFSCKRIN